MVQMADHIIGSNMYEFVRFLVIAKMKMVLQLVEYKQFNLVSIVSQVTAIIRNLLEHGESGCLH